MHIPKLYMHLTYQPTHCIQEQSRSPHKPGQAQMAKDWSGLNAWGTCILPDRMSIHSPRGGFPFTVSEIRRKGKSNVPSVACCRQPYIQYVYMSHFKDFTDSDETENPPFPELKTTTITTTHDRNINTGLKSHLPSLHPHAKGKPKQKKPRQEFNFGDRPFQEPQNDVRISKPPGFSFNHSINRSISK